MVSRAFQQNSDHSYRGLALGIVDVQQRTDRLYRLYVQRVENRYLDWNHGERDQGEERCVTDA